MHNTRTDQITTIERGSRGHREHGSARQHVLNATARGSRRAAVADATGRRRATPHGRRPRRRPVGRWR